ncbi:MAG TPA: DUF1499 domain-containing protein [Thermoanaerobaculia bacterium]
MPSLPPCPDKPNCVSTQATDSHAIEPIRFQGSAAEAMRKLLGILRAIPRTKIVASDATSVRAEFTTRIFRWVDDGLFVVDDAAKTIHFRSASRVGRSDFGVNRKRMEGIRRAFLALLLMLCIALPSLAIEPPKEKERWISVSTDGIEVFSNASERETQAIATDLLRMREAIGTITKLKVRSPVPTKVYVFRNAASFAPYRDAVLRRKNASVSGLFLNRRDVKLILLQEDSGTGIDRVVSHELAHQFLSNTIAELPLWFHEGFAEYYSTFDTKGNQVSLGKPIEEHVLWLRDQTLIPLEQLFAIDARSKDYNEGTRQGVFYAQSWALVHYLLVGNPERQNQLPRFLTLLANQKPVDEAFREAFNTTFDAMEQELRTYVRRRIFSYRNFTINDFKVPEVAKAGEMPRDEVVYQLGHLLARSDPSNTPDAESFLALAVELNPKHAAAYSDLGLLYEQGNRRAEAEVAFNRAIALEAKNPDVYVAYGTTLLETMQESAGRAAKPPEVLLKRTREMFAKATQLAPDNARAQMGLGATYLFTPDETAPGIAALEKSLALAPGDDDALYMLMQLYGMAGRRDDAQRTAEMFMARTRDAELLQQARESVLLADVRVAEGLLKEEKYNEASVLLRRVHTETTNQELKAHLAGVINQIEGANAAEGQVTEINAAIELANKGKTKEALARLDALIPQIQDKELLEATKKLRADLARAK